MGLKLILFNWTNLLYVRHVCKEKLSTTAWFIRQERHVASTSGLTEVILIDVETHNSLRDD
jgi:hypothetical protein